MSLDGFLDPRILIVSGKGGVGKTTVSAALAIVAARRGRKVCVTEVDRKGSLARIFNCSELGYEPVEMIPNVWGINIRAEDSLAEYLDVQYRMKRVSWVFTSTHFLDILTTAAPGFKDILILGKLWYLEQGRGRSNTKHTFDTIILDAPAAGHMLGFLQSPIGLTNALRGGPIRRQAEWLVDLITDPKRCKVHLVTLPEEMPVSETMETAEALRDRIGIEPGLIFANGVYSESFSKDELVTLDEMHKEGSFHDLAKLGRDAGLDLDESDLDTLEAYGRFFEARRAIQTKHLRTLERDSAEDVLRLPFLFSAGLALPDIETLADAVEEGIEGS